MQPHTVDNSIKEVRTEKKTYQSMVNVVHNHLGPITNSGDSEHRLYQLNTFTT